MKNQQSHPARSPHTFHIPVMGTGFTIDTPLRVAKYGISSVVSIGDDTLIERMRKFHSEKNKLPFEPISIKQDNYRSRRITAYLNLMNTLVQHQIADLKSEAFEPGTDLTRYFEMLPDSGLKRQYNDMLSSSDPDQILRSQEELRRQVVPGSIDVNIMTKIDFPVTRGSQLVLNQDSVVFTSLRGYAESDLCSSIVLSAGMNRRLFGFMAQFDDFFPSAEDIPKKRIVLKVSDYRSAVLQGKLLAKLGLWVAEYRIESGLNCGGHAFATKGHLLGPILEEFKQNKNILENQLREIYIKALTNSPRSCTAIPEKISITVQGGICTSIENEFLLKYYQVDSTGWGTPFLLVPEVTNVDEQHLEKLAQAGADDVYLSDCSPLGVPFWNLRTSASEQARQARIQSGRPGISCSKGYLMSNTEFSPVPICPASHEYQKTKLTSLDSQNFTVGQKNSMIRKITSKSCLCMDLAGGVNLKNNFLKNASPAICCGPSIEYFTSIATLDKMISHIYGRLSLIINLDRPHMFIKELQLYINHVRHEMEESRAGIIERTSKYYEEFSQNLRNGIDYYRNLALEFGAKHRVRFLEDLENFSEEIELLFKTNSLLLMADNPA